MKKLLVGVIAGAVLSYGISAFAATIVTSFTAPLITSYGGTGTTTANSILPSQTSNSGKYLTTNGNAPSWASVSSASSTLLGDSNTFSGTINRFTNAPAFISLTGLLKGNGSSALTVATAGSDYVNGSGTSGNCVQWGASNSLVDAGATCGAGFPFTPTTNFGALTNSTSTPIWFTAGLQASSTSEFGIVDVSSAASQGYKQGGNFALVINATNRGTFVGGYNQTDLGNANRLDNTFVGNLAFPNTNTGNGSGNTFVGSNITQSVVAWMSSSTILGANAAPSGRGSRNTLIGYGTGNALSTEAGNILIGSQVDIPNTGVGGSLNIGNLIYGLGLRGKLQADVTTPTGVPVTNPFVGIGTSSPFADFSIHANNGDTNTTLFAIGSSTASATTTLFSISNTGAITTSLSGSGFVKTSGAGTALTVDGSTYLTTALTGLKQTYGATQTGATQTLATSSDTNIGLTITTTSDTHTFTPTWVGTLADARIASAATWNAKQNAISATWPVILTGTTLSFGGLGTTSTSGLPANQFVYTNNAGVLVTAASSSLALPNTALANSTISGVALGSTLAALTATDASLTFSGSYTGATARTVGLNVGNANTWTGGQMFLASTTVGAGGVTTGLTVSGTATTTNFINTSLTSALALFDATHKETAYGGASACSSNNWVASITAVGGTGCTTIGANGLTLSMFPQVSANRLLGNASGATANAAEVATSSLFAGTVGQNAYFSGTGALVGTSSLFTSTAGNVGIGTTTPINRLDVVSPTAQLHLSTGGDFGAYLGSVTPSNLSFSGGSAFIGGTWVAKDTSSEIMAIFSGVITFFTDTGLTTGNTFSPTERFRITGTGLVGIGTASPAAKLDINGTSTIIETASTPSSSSAACITGTISWDASFIYVCTSSNTWKRSTLNAF